MRKYLIFSLLACSLAAGAQVNPSDSLSDVKADELCLQSITPKEATEYVQLDGFWHHWFIGVQGGYSSFIGKPVGCGDFFDRSCPVFIGYIGKWFTPSVGSRITFQGLKFTDSNQTKQSSQLINLDELAKVVKKHNLRVKVVGAADSATGNDAINDELSEKRTRFITDQLKGRGVSEEYLYCRSVGGISEFNVPERNRYSKVVLCLELDADNTDEGSQPDLQTEGE